MTSQNKKYNWGRLIRVFWRWVACISEEFQTCILHMGVTYHVFLPPCWESCWMVTIYLIPRLPIHNHTEPNSVVHCDHLEGLFTQRMLVPLLGLLIWWSGVGLKNTAFPNVSRGCWLCVDELWVPLIYSPVLLFLSSVFCSNKESLCADWSQCKTQGQRRKGKRKKNQERPIQECWALGSIKVSSRLLCSDSQLD